MAFSPIQECEKCEVEAITIIPQHVSSHDFIPIVSIDKEFNTEVAEKPWYEIKDMDRTCSLSGYLDNPHPIANLIEINKKESEKELTLQFYVEQGNQDAEDRDGSIEAKGFGVKLKGKSKLDVKYGWKMRFRISTEDIEEDAKVEFYAADNSSDLLDLEGEVTEQILCGILYFGYAQSVLDEMKAIADEHRPYSQSGTRDADTDEGWAKLDCSEFVMLYLYKLGIIKTPKPLSTIYMKTQQQFEEALGISGGIEFVPESDASDFMPQRGDIFVWRKSDGNGHTGIVYNVSGELVTILEAIGSSGSSDEATNRQNEGYTGKGCTRTAVYQRTGKALNAHSGWIGYYRPKNYTKTL